MNKDIDEQMIVDEDNIYDIDDEEMGIVEPSDVTSDTPREPSIMMLPLAAFIRPNYRFKEETFEDYKQSMKIQGRIRKMITRFGSQHKVGYDTDEIQLYWVMKPNATLVIPGTRRRFNEGQSRHRNTGDKRRGSFARASSNDDPDVVGADISGVSAR